MKNLITTFIAFLLIPAAFAIHPVNTDWSVREERPSPNLANRVPAASKWENKVVHQYRPEHLKRHPAAANEGRVKRIVLCREHFINASFDNYYESGSFLYSGGGNLTRRMEFTGEIEIIPMKTAEPCLLVREKK